MEDGGIPFLKKLMLKCIKIMQDLKEVFQVKL